MISDTYLDPSYVLKNRKNDEICELIASGLLEDNRSLTYNEKRKIEQKLDQVTDRS